MKLFLAVVLCVCLAQALADECGPLQRFKIKHQWTEAFGGTHERIDFGLKLWNSIFHDHPDMRGVFTRVHGDNVYSPQFEAHIQRVLGGLDMTISLLDDQSALDAQLAHLKVQHAERDLKSEYYTEFTDHLLDVLPEYLGSKLDFGAWKSCMGLITSGMSS